MQFLSGSLKSRPHNESWWASRNYKGFEQGEKLISINYLVGPTWQFFLHQHLHLLLYYYCFGVKQILLQVIKTVQNRPHHNVLRK